MSRSTLAVLAALLLAAPQAVAASPPPPTTPMAVQRDVLVVYRSAGQHELFGENPYNAIALVLEHLGLLPRYHDIARGLPTAAATADARGVIVILNAGELDQPEVWTGWLATMQQQGKAVVLANGVGFLAEATHGRQIDAGQWSGILRAMGVDYDGSYLGDGSLLAYEPSPVAPFEAPFDEVPSGFTRMSARAGEAEAVVRIRRKDTHEVTDAVVVGPRGLVAMDISQLLATSPLSYRLRWHVDPFKLFRRAFALDGMPAPDPTTVSGRRVFFAHVDGDGLGNLTWARRGVARGVAAREARRKPVPAGVIVRDELLARTALPTTVSVIADEVAKSAELRGVAKSIFAMGNVEAASHSYFHPHDWEVGTYTPQGRPADGVDPDELRKIGVKKPLVPRQEVDASFRFIDTLLPPGKRTSVMLWSGMVNPQAAVTARVEALGLPSLNGGDARLDPRHPSVANLSPFFREVDGHIQAFTGAANENLFSNLWTGPFDGQREALALFKFAEAPRRLAAVNIYYHFYAAERLGGLKALQMLYRWSEAQALAPIFASRYARIVPGFVGARLGRLDDHTWQVSRTGECRTVRFDNEGRRPDLVASRGVAGFNTANGSLYVHLAGPEATISLAEPRPSGPYMAEANAPLVGWTRSSHALRADFDACVPAQVLLAGLLPGQAVKLGGRWWASRRVDGTPAGARGLPAFKALGGVTRADVDGRILIAGPAGPVTLEASW